MISNICYFNIYISNKRFYEANEFILVHIFFRKKLLDGLCIDCRLIIPIAQKLSYEFVLRFLIANEFGQILIFNHQRHHFLKYFFFCKIVIVSYLRV